MVICFVIIYSFDGTGFKVFTEYFRNIPILKPSNSLVKDIINFKTNKIDMNMVDEWIYGLYDFSDIEISEIENSLVIAPK